VWIALMKIGLEMTELFVMFVTDVSKSSSQL